MHKKFSVKIQLRKDGKQTVKVENNNLELVLIPDENNLLYYPSFLKENQKSVEYFAKKKFMLGKIIEAAQKVYDNYLQKSVGH